jgi:outer membrane protein
MQRIVVVLFFLILTGHAHAQLHFTSLEHIFEWADKNSLVTRQARVENGVSQKDISINKSSLLPKVNVFGTAEYDPLIPVLVVPSSIVGGPPGKYEQVRLGLPWVYSSGVELTLPVINFEKWEEVKRYRLLSLQTDWNNRANMESLRIQLTQAYYQALLTRELLELNRTDLEVTDELVRVMESRKNNGLLDPSEYNRSKNLWLDMQTNKIEYQKNLTQSMIIIKQLLTLPDTAELFLDDSLPSITREWQSNLEQTPLMSRPGWREAEVKVAVAAQQLKESQRSALPVISLDGKFTHEWQVQPGQEISYDFSSIGLRLDFPLFQGNFYRNSRQKAALQLELVQASQEQTTADLSRQQSEWLNNYQAAAKKWNFLQQKMELEADNLRIARIDINEGVMEFDEFNTIFREYNQTKMDYLQNINDGIVYQLLLTQK